MDDKKDLKDLEIEEIEKIEKELQENCDHYGYDHEGRRRKSALQHDAENGTVYCLICGSKMPHYFPEKPESFADIWSSKNAHMPKRMQRAMQNILEIAPLLMCKKGEELKRLQQLMKKHDTQQSTPNPQPCTPSLYSSPQIPNPFQPPLPSLPQPTYNQQLPFPPYAQSYGQPLPQNFYAPQPANPFIPCTPPQKFNSYNIQDQDLEYYIRTNCNHMECGYDGKRTILAIKHDSKAKKFYCSVCGEVFRWRFKTHILKDRTKEMDDLLEKTKLSRSEIIKQIKEV